MAESFFDKVYQSKTMHTPDVLSCLANLSNDEVFTPPEVVNQMLDMLPQELFKNPDTTFLDPACKTGVFLREIAKRLLVGLEDKIPDLQERIDHIFQKQLYGIAITELTSLLSRRSLYCSKYPNSNYSISKFDNAEGNIRYKRIKHTWGKDKKCVFCGTSQSGELGEDARGNTLETHAYEWIHTVKPEDIFNMKFDVIISNPPYQLNDGGGSGSSAIPIYHKFLYMAQNLSPKYISMIIPARWFTGGKGLDSFRNDMLKNKNLSILHDFLDAKDCFPGVNIEGGVCYFLIESEKEVPCKIFTHQQGGNVNISNRYLDGNGKYDVFIRDEKVLSIVEKVLKKTTQSFDTIVSPRNPYGISNSTRLINKNDNTYRVFGRFDGVRGYKYISKNQLSKGAEYLNKYNIFISKADGAAGQIGNPVPARIIGKSVFGEKGDVCTETFLNIGPFDTKEEAIIIQEYMQTKFFRFLVGSRKNKNMTQDTYKYVPLLKSSTPLTDEKLFEIFNLSNEDIDYINSTISDFENNSSGGEE